MGNLADEGGVIVSEGTKNATILNEFFTSVYTKENTSEMPILTIEVMGQQ